MRNFLMVVAGILGLSLATSAPAETFQLNSKRLIEVIDVVDGNIIDQAQQLHALAEESSEPIDLLINSPGGAVIAGYMFVDAMDAVRSQGVKIRCAVGVLAASMAFNMLAHCDERVALRHAALLFHPPRIMARGPMTVPDLERAALDLRRIIKFSTGELIKMVGMSQVSFYKHFNEETLWTAESLAAASGKKWLRVVDDIKGSKKVFTHERPRMSLFFRSGSNFEIIHISPVARTGKAVTK